MLWFAKYIIALVCYSVLFVPIPDVEARRKRKCPSSCLRKIREIEKKSQSRSVQGPPGPPGSPGLQGAQGRRGPRGKRGERGQQGPAIRLPICKTGEYLTSNGFELICKPLNVDGVCGVVKQHCLSYISDGKVSPPTESSTKGPGKMMKFMKKNMIQSISTDAWDIGVFEFEGSLYFGLSQLGEERFRMFKWISGSFKDYQNFKLNNARNWSPFRIGSEQYFTVANSHRGPCSIFRYEKSKSKFVNETFSLECHRTVDVKPFHLGGVQYIAVANNRPYSTVIWRWNGRKFEPMQTISVTGMHVEVFEVNGETLLALSGSTQQGPHVYIYQWNGTRFEFIQRVFTEDRPYNLAAFEAGNEEFLAVTTLPMNSNGGRKNRILILKWSGNKFESFQNITAHWARRITAMSSPLMGKRKTTYLAIINFSNNPEIYYWVNKSSTKFDKLQDIPASMAADISFFEMGNSLYMLMSSRKNIEIFRGEVV